MHMIKWKMSKTWLCILCLILCAVVLASCARNADSAVSRSEPVKLYYNDLYMEMPDGYAYSYNDDGSIYLTYENISFGGVTRYALPEEPLDVSPHLAHEIAGKLGVPDALDDTLCHTGGASAYGHMELLYQSQTAPDEINTQHYFYLADSYFYDVWFDKNEIEEDQIITMIRTVYQIPDEEESISTQPPRPAVTGGNIKISSEYVHFGTLCILLPEGYSGHQEDDGSVTIQLNDIPVGGITCWKTPEFNPYINMSDWVKALGLPEAQENPDIPIAYMISNSIYGDLGAEYFNELDPENLNVQHEFFIDGEIVYDVYYNQNLIDDSEASLFLNTIQISGEPVIQPTPAETSAIEKCRNVLRTIQNGSYCIDSEKINEGTEALNERSAMTSWKHGVNWLSITTVPMDGILDGRYISHSKHAYMYVNGNHYSNEADTQLDNEDNVRWSESKPVQVRMPWLATYAWHGSTMVYLDTLPENDGECIMLRIDEPHPYGEDNAEHYFVNFYFDAEGNFIRVQKQVNLFMDNAYTEYESIVTLDPDAIAAEIEKEYQLAIREIG